MVFIRTTIESMKKENMQLQELIRLTQTKTDPKFVTIKGHKMTPEDQKGTCSIRVILIIKRGVPQKN